MATAYQEATNSPLDPKQGPEYASVMPKSYNEKDQIDENDRSRPESPSDVSLSGPNGEEYPTNEEIVKLRRVCGKIPITSYAIAFVELCERFSYYGTTAVFVNFIQQPLPEGSTTGSAGTYGQPGALGLGQRASTGLTLFNAFWAYVMPLLGAYMADEYWGRYMTIQVAIGIAILGHCVLIVATLPPVIAHPNGAIAAFAIGLIIFGIGVGGFKSNISPLIAEQYETAHPRQTIKTLKTGERVIVDPTATVSRIYMYFYLMINVGALIGSIGMVYSEKYVGYWLSFTLPTIMFLFCPLIMFWGRHRYHRRPPTGSVLAKALHLWGLAMEGRWSANPITTYKNLRADDFWERTKPSRQEVKPSWMTFDDAWVDEVRRGLMACRVFLWYPVYWLTYGQIINNLTSQAATLELNGVPNDIINNIDPLALIIFIPICDQLLYPFLRKLGLRFTPLKKITMGFYLGSMAMAVACVTQHFIYQQSPCGNQPNGCEEPAPISVWVQIPTYVLIAFSEIFASITGLEYAFTKAPKNMRSMVTAIFLFMSALSSALSQALVSLSADPLLVWNYGFVGVLAFFAGTLFWLQNRKLDAEEDVLNALPESTYKGKRKSSVLGLDRVEQQDLDQSKENRRTSIPATR